MNFDDLYLVPAPFSNVASRKDVNTSTTIANTHLSVPIIASNMLSVYSPELARNTATFGCVSTVHRFCSIEENVKLFQQGQITGVSPWVSIGVNDEEFDRAERLIAAGAQVIVIDVANAASPATVRQYKRLRDLYKISIVVGNFATAEQIKAFYEHAGSHADAYKVGIGVGSHCLTTKQVTGVGLPAVETILSCKQVGVPIIYDGGIYKPADLTKALALGADAVMMGRQFGACVESGAENYLQGEDTNGFFKTDHVSATTHKRYFGNASLEAYKVQDKVASFRPVEGECTYIKATGSVESMLQEYQSALRSSMSYMNAHSIEEFRKNAKWDKK